MVYARFYCFIIIYIYITAVMMDCLILLGWFAWRQSNVKNGCWRLLSWNQEELGHCKLTGSLKISNLICLVSFDVSELVFEDVHFTSYHFRVFETQLWAAASGSIRSLWDAPLMVPGHLEPEKVQFRWAMRFDKDSKSAHLEPILEWVWGGHLGDYKLGWFNWTSFRMGSIVK